MWSSKRTNWLKHWRCTTGGRARSVMLILPLSHEAQMEVFSFHYHQIQFTNTGRQLCDCGISPSPSTTNTMPTCDTYCGGSMNCNNNAVSDVEDNVWALGYVITHHRMQISLPQLSGYVWHAVGHNSSFQGHPTWPYLACPNTHRKYHIWRIWP